MIGPDGQPPSSSTLSTRGAGTATPPLRTPGLSLRDTTPRPPGYHVRHRVFFADVIAAGYRPCVVCLPAAYAHWIRTRKQHHSMSVPNKREQSRSPLIRAAELAAYGDLPAPAPPTGAELTALMDLLAHRKPEVETVAVGHGRDTASRCAAEAFTAAWRKRGGTILTVVDWPETAASWLRPATRLCAELPQAWVIAAAPLGFVQLARRLCHSTDWDPACTVAFASLQDARLPALAGRDVLHGLRGAASDGGTWEVCDHELVSYPPAEAGA